MITRSQYMQDSSNLHHAYYMQFVNESIKRAVISLCKNGKRNWWDIPLNEWDALHEFVVMNQSVKKCRQLIDTTNYNGMKENALVWSLSDSVCTLKNCAIALYGEKPCKS